MGNSRCHHTFTAATTASLQTGSGGSSSPDQTPPSQPMRRISVLRFAVPTWLRLSRWQERSHRGGRPSNRISMQLGQGRESVDELLSGFGSSLFAASTVEVTG
jgi:hypothetical protein